MKRIFLLLILFASLGVQAQKKMVLIPGHDQTPKKEQLIVMNHDIIADSFTEWLHGAQYYQVNFEEKIEKLKAIKLVKANLDFLGKVNEKEGVILINEAYAHYPSLARLKIYQLLGEYFGLKVEKTSKRDIMSDVWELNAKGEYYAEIHRFRNGTQERNYWEALEKKAPLPRQ